MDRIHKGRLAPGIAAIMLVVLAAWAGAGETGAIKKFVRFPVDTFELTGKMSLTMLEEATTPPAAQVSVDGWWPDKKMLLISFGGESYYVHYRSVEMIDQKRWDARMQATGGLVCLGATTRRPGGDPNARTAATKGFASPC